MFKNRRIFSFAENLEPEPDEELFDAGDHGPGRDVGIVQYNPGVQIGKTDPVAVVREFDADTVVEVETDAFNGFLSRFVRHFAVNQLRRRHQSHYMSYGQHQHQSC